MSTLSLTLPNLKYIANNSPNNSKSLISSNISNPSYVNNLPKALNYDGSYLGQFNFNDVITDYYPCTTTTRGLRTVALYAKLKWNNHLYPIILKRNTSKEADQVIIDQLKPLFGLNKMGTHRIRLKGIPRKIILNEPWVLSDGKLNIFIQDSASNYYILKGKTKIRPDGSEPYLTYNSLSKVNWMPTTRQSTDSWHREFYLHIQKILLFRQLVRVKETKSEDILVINNFHPPTLLSINEMKIRESDETSSKSAIEKSKLPTAAENFFFPRTTTRAETCIRMFGFENQNYLDKINFLRNSIYEVINRIDPEKIWLVDQIISDINNILSIYHHIESSEDEEEFGNNDN